MGAYKARTGKTRVGNALSKVGGFFSNIFKKKTPSTTTNTGTTPTVTPKGATQPISGNQQVSGTFWSELAVTLGTFGLTYLGSKVQTPDFAGGVITDEQMQIDLQKQKEDAQNTGSGIFVIIGVVILAIIGFFYFRSRK